jgi:hypothetical protein
MAASGEHVGVYEGVTSASITTDDGRTTLINVYPDGSITRVQTFKDEQGRDVYFSSQNGTSTRTIWFSSSSNAMMCSVVSRTEEFVVTAANSWGLPSTISSKGRWPGNFARASSNVLTASAGGVSTTSTWLPT